VLTQYNNKEHLHKLVRRPDVDPMKDAEALQAEYDKWEQDVSMMAEKKSKFELKPLQAISRILSTRQSLLSNTDYQSSDYITACAINIPKRKFT
jgi:hypothetical protein